MKTPQTASFPWFALCVRTNYERMVSKILRSKGYEELLPVYRCRRRWSDRIKEAELPLFPGYLFSRFDINERLPVLTTPGVQFIVGNGRAPVPIEEREIENLKLIAMSPLQAAPVPYLTVGQRVRIEQGALEGLEGILVALKKPWRLVVSVTLLQRSVSLEVAETWVRPLGSEKETCYQVA